MQTPLHTVLVLSEGGAITSVNMGYTATEVMYCMLAGVKQFKVLEPCIGDLKLLKEWESNASL